MFWQPTFMNKLQSKFRQIHLSLNKFSLKIKCFYFKDKKKRCPNEENFGLEKKRINFHWFFIYFKTISFSQIKENKRNQ